MRKGQKFWTIKIDRKGRYGVIPCTFQQVVNGKSYYKYFFESNGQSESIVVNIDDHTIFTTKKEALVEGIARCHKMAESWLECATELSKMLA